MLLFNLPNCNPEQVQLTEAFLKSIAWHLSSKKNCKGKVYRVEIQTIDSENSKRQLVVFECDVRLRSHYNRNYMAKVLEHVLVDHFQEHMSFITTSKHIVMPNTFVPGVYEYRLSASGRYRRWCKVG